MQKIGYLLWYLVNEVDLSLDSIFFFLIVIIKI